MKKIFLHLILCVVTINAFADTPPVYEKSASLFYKSLITSIQTAKGRVVLFLNDGYWKTKLSSYSILWNIDPFTKMTVDFDYQDGHLASSNIQFNTPIHLQVIGTKCSSIGVRSIRYSNDGSVAENPGITFDNRSCSASTIVNITRALAFSTRPEDLFVGKPFPSISGWQKCNETGTTCDATNLRDLIYEIKFYPDINQSNALSVKLKPNTTIQFSNPPAGSPNANLFHNYVVLNDGTTLNLQELDYKTDTRELSGYITNFIINVQRGAFASSDCFFDMATNSSLSFRNVNFFNSDKNSVVDASSGIVDALLSGNSFLNINAKPVNNHLLLKDNTQANMIGFKLSINENNHTTIEVGAGSKFVLKVAQGTLALGTKGFIKIVDSEIDADLAGVFQSGEAPSVVGRISKFDVTTKSGEFYPNEISKIIIGSGNLHSNELFLNSTAAPYITGTYDNFSINVTDNSVFAIPNNGMRIITEAGGNIAAQNASNPLKFTTGSNYPTGSFDVNLPYKSFVNSTFRKFALFDGTFKGRFDYDANNSIYGTDISTSGTMLMDVVVDDGKKTVPVAFAITKGSLTYNSGRPQQFSALASFKVQPSTASITLRTPPSGPIPDHDDARVYPVTLNLALQTPMVVAPTQISFNGADINLNIAADLVMAVTVPPGCGEYDGDAYSPDNCPHGGPDEVKNFQELARDKVLTSTVHIYLNSNQYTFDAALNINYDNAQSKFIVKLSNLKSRTPIAWSKDGGKLFETLGDILAFLFNGFCHILPFIDCGVKDPTTAINNAINGQIANKIGNFNKTWEIKVDR